MACVTHRNMPSPASPEWLTYARTPGRIRTGTVHLLRVAPPTSWATRAGGVSPNPKKGDAWWSRRDSNPHPSPCKGDAHPVELQPLVPVVARRGPAARQHILGYVQAPGCAAFLRADGTPRPAEPLLPLGQQRLAHSVRLLRQGSNLHLPDSKSSVLPVRRRSIVCAALLCQDSNLEPPDPESGALPSCATEHWQPDSAFTRHPRCGRGGRLRSPSGQQGFG